jgi:sugar phosphate isomerase/epimerase
MMYRSSAQRGDGHLIDKKISFSVFTKAWMDTPIDQLGKFISALGFEGIEFPLRPGYQVEPENAEKGLPELAKQMAGYGLKITSIASTTEENIFAGCAAAGVPTIRIMAPVDLKLGFSMSVMQNRKHIECLLPLCEKYNVKIAIQLHGGPMISNSMELLHLINDYNPRYIGAIWDAAHSAIAGEETEKGLDILWHRLFMINFKNMIYRRINGPEADSASWERYLTTGPQGLASWPRAVDYIRAKAYEGVICLTAEYSDKAHVNEYIARDFTYIKSLFG